MVDKLARYILAHQETDNVLYLTDSILSPKRLEREFILWSDQVTAGTMEITVQFAMGRKYRYGFATMRDIAVKAIKVRIAGVRLQVSRLQETVTRS
jgi:hypothetical protein